MIFKASDNKVQSHYAVVLTLFQQDKVVFYQ